MKKRVLGAVAVLALAALPARAGDSLSVSLGYSFIKYLEEDGGSTPLGCYLSLAGRGDATLELDLAYHRDSEDRVFGDVGTEVTLNTFTATLGPRFGSTGEGWYLHLLGGVRYDRLTAFSNATESNTAWGAIAGIGVDLKTGQSVSLRLGADFQIFFDEGENLKTLRLLAGFSF